MSPKHARILLLLVTAMLGCVSTSVNAFHPYSAEASHGFPRVLRAARVAYEGDIPALAQAGAEIVGTLDIEGNDYADQSDLDQTAAEEAARLGGTHVIHSATAIDRWTAPVGNDRVEVRGTTDATYQARTEPNPYGWNTQVRGRETTTATATYRPAPRVQRQTSYATYVVVRVERAQWPALPPALRPSGFRVAVNPETGELEEDETWTPERAEEEGWWTPTE